MGEAGGWQKVVSQPKEEEMETRACSGCRGGRTDLAVLCSDSNVNHAPLRYRDMLNVSTSSDRSSGEGTAQALTREGRMKAEDEVDANDDGHTPPGTAADSPISSGYTSMQSCESRLTELLNASKGGDHLCGWQQEGRETTRPLEVKVGEMRGARADPTPTVLRETIGLSSRPKT